MAKFSPMSAADYTPSVISEMEIDRKAHWYRTVFAAEYGAERGEAAVATYTSTIRRVNAQELRPEFGAEVARSYNRNIGGFQALERAGHFAA